MSAARLRRWLWSALGVVLAGCGARGPAAEPVPLAWQATLGRAHPLVGQVWDVRAAAPVDRAGLVARLRGASLLLLGEKHDHPDHHRLQAWVLDQRLAGGAPAVVAFEMLDAEQAPALARLTTPVPATAVAEAVGWARSGWPPFALYAPVFEAALSAGARLLAAHPDRETLRGAAREGLEGWPASRRARLALDARLPSGAEAALGQVIEEAHCGHASPAMVQAMVTAQRVKDAWMAWTLVEAAAEGVVGVLIAGAGHTRRDWGVPWYLAAHGRGALVIHFVEVDDARAVFADYSEHAAVADLVWFTPRVDDQDPCERFREQLLRLRPSDEESR